MKYRTICISDTHLGSKGAQAELLNNFLKHNESEYLYLVGDIIDGWKIQQHKWRWRQSHSNCIRRFLGAAKRGTRVTYITGNHDEFLRPFIKQSFPLGSNISIVNQAEHTGINGRRYFLTHGDIFDGIGRIGRWIYFLGDRVYDVLITINKFFNWTRMKLGFGYWSMSKWLKHNVKKAVTFVCEFEQAMVAFCKRKGYNGIICGHIHTPEIKVIDGIEYMNDGDWVESCSALVETFEGEWKIIYWEKIVETDSD